MNAIRNHATGREPLHLSFVVPVFDEEDTVGHFVRRVNELFDPAHYRLDMVFVNDGSRDSTLDRLLELQRQDGRIRILDLSRNFGKEAALSAGLSAALGQVVVPIDVDLQDPPELVHEMVRKWREGHEVVLARRVDRRQDSLAKRATALIFYRLHSRIADVAIPENVGDFRLMDRRVVDALSALPESRRFMKGLFAWMGFRTAIVDYARPERVAGQTKFNGWKLWNFALEGTTSFSTAPLRVWTYIGGLVALLAIFYGLFTIARVLIQGVDVPGYASIIVSISLLGGLQLMGIGILGEYLGRTYLESKRRPVFIVRHLYEDTRGEAQQEPAMAAQ